MRSKHSIENQTAAIVALEVKRLAAEEVKKYTSGSEFQLMVEGLKRREREKIMAEVQEEIKREKEALLELERDQMKKERDEKRRLEEILAENQRLIEVTKLAPYISCS